MEGGKYIRCVNLVAVMWTYPVNGLKDGFRSPGSCHKVLKVRSRLPERERTNQNDKKSLQKVTEKPPQITSIYHFHISPDFVTLAAH